MPSTVRITDVRFTGARAGADGHLGFVSFKLGSLVLDGVALRRTKTGEFSLSFPKRVDRAGVAHPVVRPLDQAARDMITGQVVAELRRQGAIR